MLLICITVPFLAFLSPGTIWAEPEESQTQAQDFEEGPIVSESGETIIKEVDAAAFPNISMYISFSEDSEIGVQELGRENFIITENGKNIENFEIKKIGEISEPMGIALAVDASGSMQGNPIEDAKSASRVFIDAMRDIDKITVVGFSDTATLYSSFTSDKQRLENAVAGIVANGETALFDGIIKGIEQFNNFKDLKHKYLVVLSDGADTVSTKTAVDCINKASSAGIQYIQ